MRSRKNKCWERGCENPPFSAGLCEEHDAIRTQRENLERAALDALHGSVVDGELPTSPGLLCLLKDIQKWWRITCRAVQSQNMDTVLKDEAEYAVHWCLALAKEIVLAERGYRAGKLPNYSLCSVAEQVYSRFLNLEKGLMSNGIARRPR